MAIYDLLKYNIKELYLTGFTFYKKVIGEDRYYFPEYQDAYRGPGRGNKKHPPPSLHPPDIEFDFFKKICSQDSRVRYDDVLKSLIEIY